MPESPLRIVFAGTPEFAEGILGAVVGSWIHLSSRVARVETKVEDLPCKTGDHCVAIRDKNQTR